MLYYTPKEKKVYEKQEAVCASSTAGCNNKIFLLFTCFVYLKWLLWIFSALRLPLSHGIHIYSMIEGDFFLQWDVGKYAVSAISARLAWQWLLMGSIICLTHSTFFLYQCSGLADLRNAHRASEDIPLEEIMMENLLQE